MTYLVRDWLRPERPAVPKPVFAEPERRRLKIELLIVFSITLGLSAARSLLSLIDSLLRSEPLSRQHVALNVPQAATSLVDLLAQLLSAVQLFAWGAPGAYLLMRGGVRLSAVGLDRARPARDACWGVGLAPLIGLPGLALYFASWKLGFSLAVEPSTLGITWWRPIALVASAAGNAFAEEVLVIGYLLTRLRQLGLRENTGLLGAAVLRGSYHLYQGFGGFVGNLIMGLVFGRVWQRTNRLWPLIVAHTLLDVASFVGYSLLRGHLSWLP